MIPVRHFPPKATLSLHRPVKHFNPIGETFTGKAVRPVESAPSLTISRTRGASRESTSSLGPATTSTLNPVIGNPSRRQ